MKIKKIFSIVTLLAMTLTANAQFEAEKVYIGSSLTGLDLSYNGERDMNFGFQADGGYFVEDNWLIKGTVGLSKAGKYADWGLIAGAGVRYYIQQNGLFVGLGCKVNLESNHTDVLPGAEFGYAFFINDKIAIEPALYYDHSIDDHENKSTVGLKIGLGLFF